eukprot:CAMPEP_0206440750 /NCGR_PEP_ID=MMETSP0324_2-20121206/12917_1 /ASSEMBLY_ACC=CAM_ASM_000836 /TAXON_ID=2866 /ORGANISM="Crypthecodinium cohnii, Strain Seligo" /LENGTH=109 /DNA_ID=CAMNT_0053908471 /DNA_START=274 /DNA_END=599 /DNA_ORIENTATION=+
MLALAESTWSRIPAFGKACPTKFKWHHGWLLTSLSDGTVGRARGAAAMIDSFVTSAAPAIKVGCCDTSAPAQALFYELRALHEINLSSLETKQCASPAGKGTQISGQHS